MVGGDLQGEGDDAGDDQRDAEQDERGPGQLQGHQAPQPDGGRAGAKPQEVPDGAAACPPARAPHPSAFQADMGFDLGGKGATLRAYVSRAERASLQ